MIASCGFTEEELRQCSKEEGMTIAESIWRRFENESQGVGLEGTSEKEDVQGEIVDH